MNYQQITQRASEMAGTAAHAAAPTIGRARALATDLAGRATPLVQRAAHTTAHGVATAGVQLDKATKGKYSQQISSVTTRIESTLHGRP